MTTIETGYGMIQADAEGRVTLIRSLPGVGVFLSIHLSASEAAAIKRVLDDDA